MGDFIDNRKILKKLGFDNQWIFYDDRFKKLFNFIVENITDVNILTENEILEREFLIQRNIYLKKLILNEQLIEVEKRHSGISSIKNQDVTFYKQTIGELQQEEKCYQDLISDMGTTKVKINSELIQLNEAMTNLLILEKGLLNTCEIKAKHLEELQSENFKNNNEFKKCITKIQSPSLFIHHLPLDQYFLKCDFFLQYFQLYMKENFKLQEFTELGNLNAPNMDELANKLENLEKLIKYYTIEQMKEKAKVCATQSIIDTLDTSKIHAISLVDMVRETNELQLLNVHHFKSAYETLFNDVIIHVGHRTKQRMELILFENTKEKLNRAFKRKENEKHLTKVIYDALTNAELLWIALQLDLDKIRNRSDNSQQISLDTQSSLRRIHIMCNTKTVNSEQSITCKQRLFEKLAKLLRHPLRNDAKLYLFEYEKICRLVLFALKRMVNKKLYFDLLHHINELKHAEDILKPIVFDGPLQLPNFECIFFLQSIFKIKMELQHTDNIIRTLRSQFKENITDKMDKDKFWRFNQLLWIWFLTNPRRLLMAIEEIKNHASKSNSNTVQKSIGGLKRK